MLLRHRSGPGTESRLGLKYRLPCRPRGRGFPAIQHKQSMRHVMWTSPPWPARCSARFAAVQRQGAPPRASPRSRRRPRPRRAGNGGKHGRREGVAAASTHGGLRAEPRGVAGIGKGDAVIGHLYRHRRASIAASPAPAASACAAVAKLRDGGVEAGEQRRAGAANSPVSAPRLQRRAGPSRCWAGSGSAAGGRRAGAPPGRAVRRGPGHLVGRQLLRRRRRQWSSRRRRGAGYRSMAASSSDGAAAFLEDNVQGAEGERVEPNGRGRLAFERESLAVQAEVARGGVAPSSVSAQACRGEGDHRLSARSACGQLCGGRLPGRSRQQGAKPPREGGRPPRHRSGARTRRAFPETPPRRRLCRGGCSSAGAEAEQRVEEHEPRLRPRDDAEEAAPGTSDRSVSPRRKRRRGWRGRWGKSGPTQAESFRASCSIVVNRSAGGAFGKSVWPMSGWYLVSALLRWHRPGQHRDAVGEQPLPALHLAIVGHKVAHHRDGQRRQQQPTRRRGTTRCRRAASARAIAKL